MQTLTIDESAAKKLYANAGGDFKKMLEDKFTKEFFVPKVLADEISGWKDIIRLSGANPEDYNQRPNETPDEHAYRQAKLIAAVYNNGDTLDAGNTDQWKYFPWHEIIIDSSKPSGFGLSYFDFVRWTSRSGVGVRLCFVREKDAIDAGKKFIHIYENLKIR